MTGKTHLACGVCTAVLILRPDTFAACTAVSLLSAVGAAIPDIDIENSTFNKYMFPAITAVFIVLIADFCVPFIKALLPIWLLDSWYYIIGFMALCIIGMISPHRTFTHSLTAGALFTSILYKGLEAAGLAGDAVLPAVSFAAGYISHIMLDFMNYKKMRILFPFGPKTSMKLCRTAGKIDYALRYLGCCICACTVFYDLFIK